MSAIEWQVATEAYIANHENLAAFIECCRTDRQPSAFFGPVSNIELLQMVMGLATPDEQRREAVKLFRERMEKECAEYIAASMVDVGF